MTIEAMKLALEALGWTDEWRPQGLKERAITALRTAIERTEKQEPVAWAVFEGWNAHDLFLPQEYDEALKMAGYKGDHAEVKPLYTTPPAAQRTWVGLTDEDKDTADLVEAEVEQDWIDGYLCGLKDAEAKLKEKNT
jgi:hypothetical protein